MRLVQQLGCLLLLGAILPVTAANMPSDIRWKKLANLPDREGFASPFAGVSNGALLVAGGANFPDKRPWEGGTKVWYDSVFVLESPDGQWKTGFKLPHPLGYGASLTLPDGVLCIGGSDAQRHYADVFLLKYVAGNIQLTALPALPRPCANLTGALLGHTVYVAGGIDRPDATTALKTFWALDLNQLSKGWRELEPWPGKERMLATAGVQDGSFFLCGGTALHAGPDGKPAREWLRDAYRYTPGSGWKRIADLPRISVAAPTPATPFGSTQLLILGGDDGAQINASPTDHKGFPRDILGYDTKNDQWSVVGTVPFSRVTAPSVEWNGHIVIPNGERQPGFRSPEVWMSTVLPSSR